MSDRQTALTILYETERRDGYLNLVFTETLRGENLSSLSVGFVKELVFGVMRHKLLLDKVIRNHSSLRLKKIDPKVLNILRMGVYQLLFMDKVPLHAAVSESVDLTKKCASPRTAGFVNALLRSVLRTMESGKENLFPKGNTIEDISARYSFPEPLTEFFIDTFGIERACTLMESLNETPPLCVRVNTLKISKEELKSKLLNAGIKTEDTPYTDCGLYLYGANEGARSEFSSLFTVQDQSSQLASLSLDVQKNDTVIDLCSAPGGKTTHIAELMENCGKVLAFDLYEKRLSAVRESANRLGITIIDANPADAAVQMPALLGIADRILLDVPYSGLGIIRRKPDIKYKENITDFSEITDLQKQILETAKDYLKPGGYLVYSTCTINPAENRQMVEDFLKNNPDFSLAPIDSPHITGDIRTQAQTGILELFPDTHMTDGFFVCRMKKCIEKSKAYDKN